jgi:hypothetical protein
MALAQHTQLRAAAKRPASVVVARRNAAVRVSVTRAGVPQQQAQCRQQRRAARLVTAAAAGAAGPSAADLADAVEGVEPSSLSSDVTNILLYAMNLAWTAETYEVHSWMVLLGILRYENSTAAQLLGQLGLNDLYGAWHEVLWALNVSDGLRARAFTPKLRFAYLARKVVDGSVTFAQYAGRDVVKSEDMLLALSAAGVLEHLFPDVDMCFDTVKSCIEKNTDIKYDLPDYKPSKPAVDADMFL